MVTEYRCQPESHEDHGRKYQKTDQHEGDHFHDAVIDGDPEVAATIVVCSIVYIPVSEESVEVLPEGAEILIFIQ